MDHTSYMISIAVHFNSCVFVVVFCKRTTRLL